MTQDRWNDALLDGMRTVGDPQADEVIRSVFSEGRVGTMNVLMRGMVDNDDAPSAHLPPLVRQFLEESSAMPAWADARKCEAGARLFGRYSLQITMALYCCSLPLCYAARRGVQVLHRTGRLYAQPQQRILETAQMILDVMQPGGLSPQGRGIRSAQKVRLLHAAIRHLVSAGGWDPALGVPINQEDLAGTLMAFSVAIIGALEKLGVDFTTEEAEGYLHAWKVIGHFMGIRPELLPDDMADARALSEAIIRRQSESSPEGVALTRVLITVMEEAIPGTLFDGIPSNLIRFFCGDKIADMLEVPRRDWTRLLLTPLQWLSRLTDGAGDRSAVVRRVFELFGRNLLSSALFVSHRGQRSSFAVPHQLRSLEARPATLL